MKKIILSILLLILFVQIYSDEVGKSIFPPDAVFYASSKNVDLFKENFLELLYFKNVMENYSERGTNPNITIEELLTGEYDIAVYQKKERALFVLVRQMTTEEYMTSKYYNNKNFKNVLQNGYSIYYSGTAANSFYYSYFGDNIYVGNDSDIFLQTLSNIKNKKRALDSDVDFKILVNKRIDYDFKAFSRTDDDGNLFLKNEKNIIYVKNGNPKKFYSGTQQPQASVVQGKTVDFSDFVPDDMEKVYFGKDVGVVLNKLEKDLSLFKYNDFEEFLSKVRPRIGNFVFGEKGNSFYFVFYSETPMEQEMRDAIMREYEKAAFLWGRRFNTLKNGDYGYYFELPYLGMRRYTALVKGRYFVFTNNNEYLKNFFTSKYYNLNYSKIDANKDMEIDIKK